MKKGEPTKEWLGRVVVLFVLPIAMYVFSEVAFPQYRLYPVILLGGASVVAAFSKRISETARLVRMFILVAFSLSLVFAYEEGYFSRFWFLLYLAPIYVGFLYTPKEAIALLAGAMVAFIPSLGRVDLLFDVVSYVSLLVVIPLVIYLRDRYLIIRQSKKEIMIVEEDASHIQDADTISRLLANRVTKLGVEVRQALTFVKQASAALLQGEVAPSEQATYLQRMRKRSAETLEFMRNFEDNVSANIVLKNHHTGGVGGKKEKKSAQ